MLRFRNRFKATPSQIGTCSCGRRMSFSVTEGREAVIHEQPWCERFGQLVEKSLAERGVSLHVALVNPEGHETILVADGDSVADVRDAT